MDLSRAGRVIMKDDRFGLFSALELAKDRSVEQVEEAEKSLCGGLGRAVLAARSGSVGFDECAEHFFDGLLV